MVTWTVHGWLRDRAATKHETALSEQKSKSAEECAASVKITEDLTNVHLSKITDLERRLADARRMSPATIRPRDVPASPARADAARDDGLCGGNEVSTEPFWDIARAASTSSAKMTDLQSYVRSLEPFIARCEGR